MSYKYIHIFWQNDFKFNPSVVKMIIDPNNGLNPDEHLFVTPHKEVYTEINNIAESKSSNNEQIHFELYEAGDTKNARIVNYYATLGDWLIVHSMPPPHKAIFIKNKYCSKIVWRTWGHDIGYYYRKETPIKNLVKYIIGQIWKYKVKKFHAIGRSNIVDELNIRERFGDVKTFRMPYQFTSIIDIIDAEQKEKITLDGTINIMVGHFGRAADNHIQMMKRLEHLKNDDIHLYFILSYGDSEYIKDVKNYISKGWHHKSTIVTNFLPRNEYVNFLNQMDVIILDGPRSYALGNINLLIYLRKKLFVNRNGIIRKAFDLTGIPYCLTDELENMTYDELKEPLIYPEIIESSFLPRNREKNIESWKNIFASLDSLSND